MIWTNKNWLFGLWLLPIAVFLLRRAAVKICNIGSRLAIPLIFLGAILSFEPLMMAGIVCFMLVIAFQLITLPVEFNASSRAIKAIDEMGILYEDETKSAEKVLSAAALTYVASLVVSLANLLRLFLRFNNRR